MEEMEQKGTRFSSELREFKVPGGLQVEKPHRPRRSPLCEPHLASCDLERPNLLSPKPQGVLGPDAFSFDGPLQALLVTLTHHSPLKLLLHPSLPRGGDGR